MRWLKHMTSTWDDEKIAAVVDELGLEGYGFWWRILEIIATQLDEYSNTSCEYSAKKWGSFFNFSAKKFEKFAKIFQNSGILQAEFFENSIRISIPNLLKYRDEWTKKKSKNSGVTPEELRRKESDTESDKEEDIKTPHTPHGGDGGGDENSPPAPRGFPNPAPGSQAIGPEPCGADDEQASSRESVEQEPPIEFQELRQFYDAEMRVEGPMAGWKEYKQAKAGGYWPGVSRIVQDIEERKKAHVWNQGYELGLGRYLAERTWLAAVVPRASPGNSEKPATPTEYQKNKQEQREMAKMLLEMRQAREGAQNATGVSKKSAGNSNFGKVGGGESCLSGGHISGSIEDTGKCFCR